MKRISKIIYKKKVTVLLYVISSCFIVPVSSVAQLLTNNNILISNSAQITIKGDVESRTGTVISNTGTIDLTGNWTNNSGNNLFGVSTGTVILNGGNQVIQGADQTLFNNLTLLNGTKTLDQNTTTGGNNATPLGILSCNNAVLNLNSKTLTVNNPNGNAISNTTGYILSEDADNSSKVKWKISTTAGIHTIPFGNSGGTQVPFSYNLHSGDAGDVTVSTYPSAPNNTPFPATPTMVTHVRDIAGVDNSGNTVDRFWQVDKTGAAANASYTFSYAFAENAANGNINTRAQQWNTASLGWNAAPPGQVNPTSQSVLVPSVTYSGVWAVALQAAPLPVELLIFSARARNNKTVVCNWSTASEINNDFFTVERSRDGKKFEEAGIINGNGSTNIQHDYSFEDKNPYKGISYYRLKQTDFNGAFTYSHVENVLITSKELQYLVFPNPSNGIFNIKFNTEENEEAYYLISDATGRVIKNERLSDQSGLQSVSLEKVPAGFYFVQIVNGDSKFLSKIQVIR